MILGLGVDLCPVERMAHILDRHGDLFSKRVFTDRERAYSNQGAHRGERFAARFAAKEATIKALGGPEGLRWRDMEVIRADNGAPGLLLHGKARSHAESMGVSRYLLSLSHTSGMAVAMVVLEGGENVE